MTIDETLSMIVRLPVTFGERGDVSMYELVAQSGYGALHEEITVHDIHSRLVRAPECVDSWIAYSEDKRCSCGWYIKEGDTPAGYVVGRIGDDSEEARFFTDKFEACAHFIKRELDEILNL